MFRVATSRGEMSTEPQEGLVRRLGGRMEPGMLERC